MIRKNIDIEIRPETHKDYPAIYDLNKAAFGRKDEACLVDRLRGSKGFHPELSLVASNNNRIVGHILFTKIKIVDSNNTKHESLALAPMAVYPDVQRKGIGSNLIKYGLTKAKEMGYNSVIVLGHDSYYPRFGFEPTTKWQIKSPYNVPSNVFMGLELSENALADIKGTVEYPREFEEL